MFLLINNVLLLSMIHVYHNKHCDSVKEPNRVTIINKILETSRLPTDSFDMYQFGVPTHMKYISKTVTNYTNYWGFDSFLGLPEEEAYRYKNPLWKKGSFFMTRKVENVIYKVKKIKREIDAKRINIVPGFYNVSLTEKLAKMANPAFFIDVNCDLYVSTKQALEWIFKYNLAKKGTLILYDDWQNTPFGEGESLVHMEISRDYMVQFEVAWHDWGNCHLIVFRVKSIGKVSDHGIPEFVKKYNVWN